MLSPWAVVQSRFQPHADFISQISQQGHNKAILTQEYERRRCINSAQILLCAFLITGLRISLSAVADPTHSMPKTASYPFRLAANAFNTMWQNPGDVEGKRPTVLSLRYIFTRSLFLGRNLVVAQGQKCHERVQIRREGYWTLYERRTLPIWVEIAQQIETQMLSMSHLYEYKVQFLFLLYGCCFCRDSQKFETENVSRAKEDMKHNDV